MQILDQGRRGQAGRLLQGGETHRAFSEEFGENRPLPADSQGRDQSPVFCRERTRREPPCEAATAVWSHAVALFEALEMISHRSEGDSESPREFSEVQSRLGCDQREDALTRGQQRLCHKATRSHRGTPPRRARSKSGPSETPSSLRSCDRRQGRSESRPRLRSEARGRRRPRTRIGASENETDGRPGRRQTRG